MSKVNLQIRLWNLKIRLTHLLTDLELLAPWIGALILLASGIYLAIWGFLVQHPHTPITFTALLPDFYANASTTLVGIALTVLIIDGLNRRRDDRLEKIRLIRDMGCGDNGIAARAVIDITENNLHWKGFLRNRHFFQASLARVKLMSADLSHSSFHYSDLTGADFFGAKLYRTCFWGCRLRGVDFRNADLTYTDFIYADLTDALVTREQLQSADRLLGARLPDGKVYDGRFNRPVDLQIA
jgi:hypothetical protein